MPGSPHGTFEFEREGNVIHMTLSGTSNEEGAQARTEALRAFWEDWVAREGRPQRWAMLVDLRQWQGATPEAFAYSAITLRWAIANGLSAAANIVADPLLQHIVKRHLDRAEQAMAATVVTDMFEARQWLREQGFALGSDPVSD
ncbi:MAG: hypothetical protein QM776_02425 [Rhodocyclaceae bacterium]